MGRGSTAARAQGTDPAPQRALRIALCTLAIAVGILAIALGGFLIATAHPTQSVLIEGSIADYQEILIDGAYARNELRLVDDNRTFTLDAPQFHPALPERFLQYGKIRIWVAEGTTTALAVALYDQFGLNPTIYTTDTYEHPVRTLVEAQAAGALAGGAGLAAIIAAVLVQRGWRLPGRSKPTAPEPVPVPVGARAGTGEQGQWDLTLFGTGSPSAQPGQGGLSAIDQLPTQKTPAVFPAADAPGRQSGPPAPGSRTAPPSIDQLPTQKTPALPTPPLAPGSGPAMPGGFAMPQPGPQTPRPSFPSQSAPNSNPNAGNPAYGGGANWGAGWGAPAPQSGDQQAWPAFPSTPRPAAPTSNPAPAPQPEQPAAPPLEPDPFGWWPERGGGGPGRPAE
jgi:hypothetical protein